MQEYIDLLEYVMDEGEEKPDRTGTGTLNIFGKQISFSLLNGFPILSLKEIHFKSIVHELLWFLKGDTNVAYLQKHKVKIWDAWADEKGDLGPIYGHQWRSWSTKSGQTIDQIKQAIHLIKTDPYSRRILVSAWNVSQLEKMALYPCHVMFQFYVSKRGLECYVYQRSADLFLGVPFNIASYALLTCMIAQVCDLKPYRLTMSFGDTHIYKNHTDQVEELLRRSRKDYPKAPKLILNPGIKNIDNFTYDDVDLQDYNPLPKIPAPIAI